jgi:hypothetical protein
MTDSYTILAEKPERKRRLRKLGIDGQMMYEYKVYFKKILCGVGWILVAQARAQLEALVTNVTHLHCPKSGKFPDYLRD